MRDIFRIRVKTRTGEIEIEGSQQFVDKKMEQLPGLIKKLDHVLAGATASTNKISISKIKTDTVQQPTKNQQQLSSKTTTIKLEQIKVPNSIGQWYAKFPDKIRQADVLLIACYFIQHRSPDNVFKFFLAKNAKPIPKSYKLKKT